VKAFLFSPAARADLAGIWDFTAERWSVEQAERYVRDIADACQALADGRREGRAVDDVRPGYLKLAVGSHFLFYRITAAGIVEIVRILHQRMDIAARLE
jgi:toxin ParE1/3/4